MSGGLVLGEGVRVVEGVVYAKVSLWEDCGCCAFPRVSLLLGSWAASHDGAAGQAGFLLELPGL